MENKDTSLPPWTPFEYCKWEGNSSIKIEVMSQYGEITDTKEFEIKKGSMILTINGIRLLLTPEGYTDQIDAPSKLTGHKVIERKMLAECPSCGDKQSVKVEQEITTFPNEPDRFCEWKNGHIWIIDTKCRKCGSIINEEDCTKFYPL